MKSTIKIIAFYVALMLLLSIMMTAPLQVKAAVTTESATPVNSSQMVDNGDPLPLLVSK